MKKRYLVIMLILLSVVSLLIGAKNITISDIISFKNDSINIMLISRVPRLIAILLAGIGMSICGLIMQQISKNKFVSPTTGATIDSAQLGIVVAMILMPNASSMQKALVSFVFALAGTYIFMKFIRTLKFKDAIFIPLVGIMCGNIIGSLTSFLGYRFELMQSINSWMQGKFSMILRGNYELIYISIPLIIIAILYANKFTVAGMGEDFAKNLGVDYEKVVNLGLVIVALVTVSVVITAGNIPYIGLIVPNIVSLYKGDNVGENIGHTALFGALFVLVCDILRRIIIYPYELSVGLTIGVLGSAIFLCMIFRRAGYGLNAKVKIEKEESKKYINKKSKSEIEAGNKIFILGILILVVSGLFLCIGLNANNMDYALSQRIPKLLSIILTGVCISYINCNIPNI